MKQYTENELTELYKTRIATGEKFVFKVGTHVLTDQATGQLNDKKIEDIVDQAAELYKDNREVAIVTSGAIGAGKAALHSRGNNHQNMPMKQALASIGQADLIGVYKTHLQKYGLLAGQVLLTYDDLRSKSHRANFINTANALYAAGAMPIINENDTVSIEELETENGRKRKYSSASFGDNDLLSVMAAEALDTQVLFMISKEEGLMDYSSRTKIHVVDNMAHAYQYVSHSVSQGGKGGMKSKLKAIERATKKGIYVVLLSGMENGVVTRVLQGEPLGTLFLPKKFK